MVARSDDAEFAKELADWLTKPMLAYFAYFKDYFRRSKLNRLRKLLRPGQTISRFIARDVKREALVVSADEIEATFVTVRIRTMNVLYLSKGLVQKEYFGPAA